MSLAEFLAHHNIHPPIIEYLSQPVDYSFLRDLPEPHFFIPKKIP